MNEQRTTKEVLQDHLDLAQRGDLDADIPRNFDPDCVLMTSYGTFRGHAGVREAAELLVCQMGSGGYHYTRQEWHQELAFLEWTVDNDRVSIPGWCGFILDQGRPYSRDDDSLQRPGQAGTGKTMSRQACNGLELPYLAGFATGARRPGARHIFAARDQWSLA